MHSADFTDVDSVKLDSREHAPVMQIGYIGQLATQTVESLDDEHVKDAMIKIGEQSLISGTKAGGPANCGVGVGADDRPSLLVHISRAYLDLVGDRGFPLIDGAVSGINSGAQFRLRY